MLWGSQTGVGGRKFAGCGYVDGGVRGIFGVDPFLWAEISTPADCYYSDENFVGGTDSDFVLYHPGDDIDLTNCEDTSTQP